MGRGRCHHLVWFSGSSADGVLAPDRSLSLRIVHWASLFV